MPLIKIEFSKNLEKRRAKVVWSCRFHPTNSWHEAGCPHQEWTKEQLVSALITKKEFEQRQSKVAVMIVNKKEK